MRGNASSQVCAAPSPGLIQTPDCCAMSIPVHAGSSFGHFVYRPDVRERLTLAATQQYLALGLVEVLGIQVPRTRCCDLIAWPEHAVATGHLIERRANGVVLAHAARYSGERGVVLEFDMHMPLEDGVLLHRLEIEGQVAAPHGAGSTFQSHVWWLYHWTTSPAMAKHLVAPTLEACIDLLGAHALVNVAGHSYGNGPEEDIAETYNVLGKFYRRMLTNPDDARDLKEALTAWHELAKAA